MSKNIKIATVLLLVLGIGGFLLISGKNDETELSSEPERSTSQESDAQQQVGSEGEVDAVVIKYTNDGFDPAEQTVEVGQTVRFVNESDVSMWVASDDHPTHTNYSEFDNQEGVGPGEAYEFTFDKVGEWGYHDHLDSTKIGTITVTE